eukprot:scaffold118933_cov37-Tisochrysis_lutea.AAC.1
MRKSQAKRSHDKEVSDSEGGALLARTTQVKPESVGLSTGGRRVGATAHCLTERRVQSRHRRRDNHEGPPSGQWRRDEEGQSRHRRARRQRGVEEAKRRERAERSALTTPGAPELRPPQGAVVSGREEKRKRDHEKSAEGHVEACRSHAAGGAIKSYVRVFLLS